jgi:hypothetical protein
VVSTTRGIRNDLDLEYPSFRLDETREYLGRPLKIQSRSKRGAFVVGYVRCGRPIPRRQSGLESRAVFMSRADVQRAHAKAREWISISAEANILVSSISEPTRVGHPVFEQPIEPHQPIFFRHHLELGILIHCLARADRSNQQHQPLEMNQTPMQKPQSAPPTLGRKRLRVVSRASLHWHSAASGRSQDQALRSELTAE